MDPAHLDRLIKPIIDKEADYTKGNRFRDFEKLKSMPHLRILGNSLLSFLVKLASGYWDIIDPLNGYTAIHRSTLENLNLNKLSRRYFFETDMLINLNIANAAVKDIDISARYGDEESFLTVGHVLMKFPPSLLCGLIKRIVFKYFVYDFNMASVYILLGLPMFVFSLVFGTIQWVVP